MDRRAAKVATKVLGFSILWVLLTSAVLVPIIVLLIFIMSSKLAVLVIPVVLLGMIWISVYRSEKKFSVLTKENSHDQS